MAATAGVSRITTRQHPVVRQCREAARRHGASERVVLDGAHLVLEALTSGAGGTLEAVLVTDEALDAHPALARALRTLSPSVVYRASAAALDAASPARTPSGVVALARWQPVRTAPLFESSNGTAPLVVGLVDVQDPGNVGAVVRAADALGATGVACLGHSADPSGWKALRGSMGSVFRLPVARGETAAALVDARQRGVALVAATTRGGVAPSAVVFERPTMLLLGSEGAGLPDRLVADADVCVTLDIRPEVESLNVSVAAALLLDAARRRRRAR
jgi:TrmH family RNA methyltransferase